MALTAAWLVLALLASWAPTARADDPASLGGLAPTDASPPPPSPDPTGTTTGGGTTDPGSTNATDPNAGSGAQTPTDPSPPQDTGTPVENPPSSGLPADGGSAGGSGTGSTTDPQAGGSSAVDTPTDTGSGDANKTASKTGSPTSDPPVSAPGSSAGPPSAGQGTSGPLSGTPDEVWVEQWSAFTQPDIARMLPGHVAPGGIHLATAGGFVFLRTGKTMREARARQKGETAKASALRPGLVLPGGPAPGSGFFDLFTGSGGGGATLMVFGLLGILAVKLLPVPRSTQALRLPAVTWRPSEYVPPIEQPG